MLNHSMPVHKTITTRIEDGNGGGWEFVCPECNYRARYLNFGDRTGHRLVILHAGDQRARHTNNQMDDMLQESWLACNTGPALSPEDEAWLTPEIRQKLEAIASRLDD